MLFSSLIFLFLFLPAVLFCYFVLCKSRKLKNRFLLLASLFFYGWGEPIYVFLMMGCIFGNYCFGRLIHHYQERSKAAKTSLVLMLVFNLGILAYFKYAGFFVENLNQWFQLSLPVPEITLPIGISFFTFQGISYVIDVYRGQGEALKNPLDVGLYLAFFPQLIAGPIVRYQTVAKEIQGRRENLTDFADGVRLFVIGLAKKVLLANNFALIADKAFGLETPYLSVSFAWLGAIAYTMQIYFDFGGYSDMAIGLGRMFGFHFLPNFRYPYIARSITDFWRRWHISLSSWFRDYVYIPLGGSRVNRKWKLVRNLLIVWACTGFWHGANWTFLVWGLYYFCFLCIEKLTGLNKKLERIPVFSNVVVLLIVVVGWVIFRADTLTAALDYLSVMFGLTGNALVSDMGIFYWCENRILVFIGLACCLPWREWLQRLYRKSPRLPQWFAKGGKGFLQIGATAALAVILVTSVSFLVKGGYNPFIYFNF